MPKYPAKAVSHSMLADYCDAPDAFFAYPEAVRKICFA